jgi:hypothetical protein
MGVLAYATRLTGDRTAAEDVVQETLIRAWRHPEALANRKGSARRWLEEPKWALACAVTVVGHRRLWCSAGVIWHICDMPLATEEANPHGVDFQSVSLDVCPLPTDSVRQLRK